MQKTIKYQNNFGLLSFLCVILAVIALSNLAVFATGLFLFRADDPSNLNTYEGTVTRIYDQDTMKIIELDHLENFALNKELMEEYSFNYPSEEDYVKVSYARSKENNEYILITRLEVNNELTIDFNTIYQNNDITLMLTGLGITIVSLILFIICFKNRQKKKVREMDAVNFWIMYRSGKNNIFNNPEFESYKYYQRHKRASALTLVMMVIMALEFVFTIGHLDTDLAVALEFGLLIFGNLGIAIYSANTTVDSKASKKKRAIDFSQDYLKYLTQMPVNLQFAEEFFQKDGVHFLVGEEEQMEELVVPTSDLNLHARCLYTNNMMQMRIFICSDIIDEEKYEKCFDMIYELSPELLKFLKENQMEVKGLDYLLNNLNEEVEKNIKESNRVIDYRDF